MIGLTKKQQETISFIRSFRDQHGIIPSYGEIAQGIGVKSRSRVKQVLDDLVERGAIRRLNHRARAIELVEPNSMQAILLNREVYSLLSAYASGMKISIDVAAGELLRGALGAA